MKTNIFKSVLPALAILLAMGLSFAVEAKRVSQIGYFDDPFIPGIQQVNTDCSINGTLNLCEENGYQLYNESALINPLKRVAP